MYEFLSRDELVALEEHESVTVRHLVEDARQLASELLLARMQEYGVQVLGDGNAPELPRLLWQAVLEGPKTLSDEQVGELERLAHTAQGWWRFGERKAWELVTLTEWEAEYEEE